MNKRVAITGTNGFIGGRLAEYFASHGYQVRSLARSLRGSAPIQDHFDFDLAKPVSAEALSGVDVLIHCAHTNAPVMINGTQALLQRAREAGVRQFIFISSMAAAKDSLSEYGRLKSEIEALLDPAVDLILRPGLVLGDGGLFGRMAEFIKRSPLVPLLGGGTQPVQTVHVEDLVRGIAELIALNQAGLFQVAAAPSLTMRELYLAVAEKVGGKKTFLNVPMGLAGGLISVAEMMGIPLPVNKENFLGLKQLGRLRLAPAAPLSFSLRDYRASLDDLFRTTRT